MTARRLLHQGLRGLGHFWRDRRGVSAIEFALIAPFLILMYVGLAELSQGMAAQRRASHAASAVGDLITQSDAVTSTNLDDVLNAGATLMQPFSSTNLKLRVTSVTADATTGTPKADWSRGKNGLTAYTCGASITGIPSGLLANGDNLLLAEATYSYTSPVVSVLPKPFSFNEKFYLKARKSSKVTCSNCCP